MHLSNYFVSSCVKPSLRPCPAGLQFLDGILLFAQLGLKLLQLLLTFKSRNLKGFISGLHIFSMLLLFSTLITF